MYIFKCVCDYVCLYGGICMCICINANDTYDLLSYNSIIVMAKNCIQKYHESL